MLQAKAMTVYQQPLPLEDPPRDTIRVPDPLVCSGGSPWIGAEPVDGWHCAGCQAIGLRLLGGR